MRIHKEFQMENQTNERRVERILPDRPLAAQWMIGIAIVTLVLLGYGSIAGQALRLFKAQLNSLGGWTDPRYLGLYVVGVVLVLVMIRLPRLIIALNEGVWRILDVRHIRADLREEVRR